MATDPHKTRLDAALARVDHLCRRAIALGAAAPAKERLSLIADLEIALAALRLARTEIRARLARVRTSAPAVTAYGRAHLLRPAHR